MNTEHITLVASFGTSHEDACENNITAVEIALANAFPHSKVLRAFTSSIIRRVLERRGIHVDSLDEALDKAEAQGCEVLTVVPTHILAGGEYQMVVDAVTARADRFFKINYVKPLLFDHTDYRVVLQALVDANPLVEDEALVLMGHGTNQAIGVAYAAIDFEARTMGLKNVFVGTVEGYPTLQDTIARVKAAGFSKALITPLMLVAGDHAKNDMAGNDEDSWKNVFAREGIEPRCLIKGLGEYPEVLNLYVKHVGEVLKGEA